MNYLNGGNAVKSRAAEPFSCKQEEMQKGSTDDERQRKAAAES